jgi:hypothetical protein
MSTKKEAVCIADILNSSFTFSKLARRWECTRQHLYNMEKDGELKTFKLRNCKRVTGAEVIRHEKGDAACHGHGTG